MFGRYPPAHEEEYPLIDLVVCHGDFLNADHSYCHQNRSIRGFGSYGDLLLRDRKIYVAPTPFALITGATANATLIAPEDLRLDGLVEPVGELVRTEADEALVGYSFDLLTSELTPKLARNPHAGRQHRFLAYRRPHEGSGAVKMTALSEIRAEMTGGEDGAARSV